MANQLSMAIQETILSLHKQGWSKRRIARELGLHRDTVRRCVKAAAAQIRPEVTTGFSAAFDSKQATSDKVTTGSNELSAAATTRAVPGGRSLCEPFREIVGAKVGAGLSAQRIYQDLQGEHGFTGGYESVKRMVRRMSAGQDPPFRRMECAPGAEAQIDFGGDAGDDAEAPIDLAQ